MEKRLFAALGLSVLVLMAWSALTPKSYHAVNKEVKEIEITAPGSPATPLPSPELTPPETAKEIPESLYTLSRNNTEIIFNDNLGTIKEIVFKNSYAYTLVLDQGFLLASESGRFRRERVSDNSVVYVQSGKTKKITKEFIYSKWPYELWLSINVQNNSSSPITISMPLILGIQDYSPQNVNSRYQEMFYTTKEKTTHFIPRKEQQSSDVVFVGLRDRYFAALIQPEQGYGNCFVKRNNSSYELGLASGEIRLDPGQQIGHKFRIYLGPQSTKIIKQINPDWTLIVNYGMFDAIAKMLLSSLDIIHSVVRSWGLAIIIFSLLVYIILSPLTIKQMRSMKEMQHLQPKIAEIQKRYKDDRQKSGVEIMKLYKEHKVNPASGCLPMLLQLPIFFALYQALLRSIDLKGASFLWIKDLSEPDKLFTLPISLPVVANEFNLLPILMTVAMFIQQKTSSVKVYDQEGAAQQKMMMVIMPFMFGFIFYRMPSSLVIYWFINSLMTLLMQFRMSRAQ